MLISVPFRTKISMLQTEGEIGEEHKNELFLVSFNKILVEAAKFCHKRIRVLFFVRIRS